MEAHLASFREARQRGLDWLISLINDDGSIGPVAEGFFYYRLPWALAVTGVTERGVRLCNWVRRHQFTAEGDCSGVSPRTVASAAYDQATFVVGAQMLRQFDLSFGGYQYLLTHRNAASGGFRHLPEGTGIAAEENIPTVAQAGKTALMMGDLATAEAAAGWFQRVWEAQPALPDRLYYVYSSEHNGLVSDYPADRATQYVVAAQVPRQRFTCGGIAAAFLCRLYQAAPKPEYLELARQYQAFAMQSTERQFEVPQVCKTGWGSALLYQLTREPAYRDWTLRVGEYYVASQFPDGHWENRAPHQGLPYNIMITAEFVVHLDTLIAALATC